MRQVLDEVLHESAKTEPLKVEPCKQFAFHVNLSGSFDDSLLFNYLAGISSGTGIGYHNRQNALEIYYKYRLTQRNCGGNRKFCAFAQRTPLSTSQPASQAAPLKGSLYKYHKRSNQKMACCESNRPFCIY